jgi:hypothetical protein
VDPEDLEAPVGPVDTDLVEMVPESMDTENIDMGDMVPENMVSVFDRVCNI